MSEVINWASHNALASLAVIIAFALVVLSITTMYLVAFFQGRDVAFWPPKIGPKPQFPNPTSNDSQSSPTDKSTEREEEEIDGVFTPPFNTRQGSILISAAQNNFSLGRKLYSGTNATVFEAESHAFGRVIIKQYRRGLDPDSPAWNTFQQELRVAEIMSHRNIVKVFDRGLSGGYPFLVMEYFAGGTLRDWLDSHDRLPGTAMLSILGQLADGIDFAHSLGVIHRDLKPGNIFFESDLNGRIAISDFGIARILGAVERNITQEIVVAGSLDYLAPEALSDMKITSAVDIYAFGVILFEMVARRTPFQDRGSIGSVLVGKQTEDAPDVRDFITVPPEVASRIAVALKRNPSDRPTSARATIAGVEPQILQIWELSKSPQSTKP